MTLWRIFLEIARRVLYFAALGALRGLMIGAALGAVLGVQLTATAHILDELPSSNGRIGPLEYVSTLVAGLFGGFLNGALPGAAVWALVFCCFAAFQPAAANYKAHASFSNAITRATEAGVVGTLLGAASTATIAYFLAKNTFWKPINTDIPWWPSAPLWAYGYYYGAIGGLLLGSALGAGFPAAIERVSDYLKALFASTRRI